MKKDQLVIRVGKACNFKCKFCNVSDNETGIKMKESISDIVRNFHYRLKYSNFKNKKIYITISGGEPSIFQKETIFILKYSRRILEKLGATPLFDIQTNGANIDFKFANKIKKLGITDALVSFHTHDEKVFNDIIGVNYNIYYNKIITGIENLNRAGIRVCVNIIVFNNNKHLFFKTIKFLESKFPYIYFNMGIIQPHGEGGKNMRILAPKYEDIYYSYNKSIFYLLYKGKEILSHLVGPPACYLMSFKYSGEIQRNIQIRKDFNFTKKYLISNINDRNKKQINDCKKCLYNNVCSGIWEEYIGFQKLKPLFYIVDKKGDFCKNIFAQKIFSLDANLKKIYDGNKRQVIIPSSIGTKEEIIKKLKEATKIGFFKVTLLVDSEILLDDEILFTGVSNIQINIEFLSINFLERSINFSLDYFPQFQIDLDVFIKYTGEILLYKELYKKIKKFLYTGYIKIHNLK